MLINDADWELLVSTAGQPSPNLPSRFPRKAFHQAQIGGLDYPLSHSDLQTETIQVSHP